MKIKYLASSFFLYAIATGINKGILLISLPMLSGVLSIEDYGIWSLSQGIIVLGSAIFSLNGYAAIVRFGVEDKSLGYNIFKKYFKYTFLAVILTLICVIGLGYHWITLTLILALLEAFQFLLLGLFRSRDAHINYFLLSLAKIVAISVTVFLFEISSIENLLLIQGVIIFILILLFYFICRYKYRNSFYVELNINKFLRFSLFLLPHNVSLWILSSSDRYLIKFLLNDLELGFYGLAYSLALILMLLNSGIGLTLPNYVITNYEYYITSNLKVIVIAIYSLITIVLNISLYFSIIIGKDHISYLLEVNNNLYEVIIWVFNGIYLLGLYYFYSNILFYHKKAKSISMNTLIISVINIILTIIFVQYYGIKGAAIATFISYFLYFTSNIIIAYNVDNKIKKDIPIVFGILIFTVITNFYIIELFPKI